MQCIDLSQWHFQYVLSNVVLWYFSELILEVNLQKGWQQTPFKAVKVKGPNVKMSSR